MDISELAKLKDDVQLGIIAHDDLSDLEPKIKRLAEAVKYLYALMGDLVDRLPEDVAAEYADDLDKVADLLRFGP